MIKIKVSFYMRRRDVIDTLRKIGISEREVDKAIKNKVIKGDKFTGVGARCYYRAEVVAIAFGLRFEVGDSECYLFSVPTANATTSSTGGVPQTGSSPQLTPVRTV